jgi:putative transposase
METTTRMPYPSDLTDLQWDNSAHLFPCGDGTTGRPRVYPLREIVNAVLYLARGGGGPPGRAPAPAGTGVG